MQNHFYHLKSTLALVLALMCLTTTTQAQSPMALKGAKMYDGNGGFIEDAVIMIEDGRITQIADASFKIPRKTEVIDCEGKFIMPGMVDAHMHFFQSGFFDSRPDALDIRDSISYFEVYAHQKNNPDRYYESYLRAGVTAVYDVGGFTWSIAFQKAAEANHNAPHVAASGPLITPVPPQFLKTFNTPGDNVIIYVSSEEHGRDIVRQNHALGATGIKIWTMAPDDADFQKRMAAIEDEANRLGTKLIIHATELSHAKMAMQHGAKLLVHSINDAEVDAEFIEMAKANDVIYTPNIIVSRGYHNAYKAVLGTPMDINDPNNIVDAATLALLDRAPNFRSSLAIDDEGADEWLSTQEAGLNNSENLQYGNMRVLHEAGIRLVIGTDAGNPGTLHGISIYDELEAFKKAGIPAEDIIVMATRNGAMAMERIDDFGTLEVGKMADLIILAKDPGADISNTRSITHVVRGGTLHDVSLPFKKN